ncbi:hypothetical protein BDQ12DRAFT_384622 [Crucibulum laeve]|uniref:Uncharacterized protein n=1 Tax=Crucibulum laeve TaxID=68775 RepID=A0A5C3LYY9_9AGAR|nr:hypothetical protein BDQ12DRAFT_384622 [Crucibulum laeve]
MQSQSHQSVSLDFVAFGSCASASAPVISTSTLSIGNSMRSVNMITVQCFFPFSITSRVVSTAPKVDPKSKVARIPGFT